MTSNAFIYIKFHIKNLKIVKKLILFQIFLKNKLILKNG